MKKTLALALAVVMAMGTMAGCSSGTTSSEAASGTSSSAGTSGTESTSGSKIYYTSSTTAASNISPHDATSSYDSEITDLTTAYLYRYVATEDR